MDRDLPCVLVLDANQRSALAVTRSLGKSGQYRVSTADSISSALSGASRFSQAYYQYPDPNRCPKEFVSWIRNFSINNHFDLFMPTTEVTSQLLLQFLGDLPTVELPFAPHSKVMELADKVSLVKLAQILNVPVPESQIFNSLADIHNPEELKFPLVIKPALSHIFRDDKWVHTQVRVVRDFAGWCQAVEASPYLSYAPFMLQEFIPGYGGGIFCLYNKGQPVQFFAHQRLREKPPEGGVSVLSRSVPVTDELKSITEKLLNAAEWHGVAMVEFRITPDGKPYLMEINTRFWGSLQLAVDAGVNFPLMLANAQLGRPVVKKVDYDYDQRLRWLLGDLDSLYLFLKKAHPWQEKIRKIVCFLTIRWHKQKHEINRLDDLMPAWVEFKQYIRALVK